MALHTWTWNKIIKDALIESGRVGENQPISNQALQIGQSQLEYLLDEWDGKGLSLPSFDARIEFNTVADQAKYILGPDSNTPFTDAAPASTIRPESFVAATVDIGTDTEIPIRPIPFPRYQNITVKQTTASQPFYYAWNPLWPQGELYFYPKPDAVYPITLTVKSKWQFMPTGTTEVGRPSENPSNVAQLQSGFAVALKDNLKLKIAKRSRLVTQDMIDDAREGRYTISAIISGQQQSQVLDGASNGVSTWPWVVGDAGRNP